ncbi:uncharacterized protein [Diadema setosum]|uniref:uncharacterized protein n=1 Tax=Diadema setosum TaxID=31175 RepID=UPI003B3A5972
MQLSSVLVSHLLLVVNLLHHAQGEMKPTKFAKEVVCEGCHAVIAEANKILGKGKRTDKVVKNTMKAVCNVQRLNSYEFSPPNMNKVCDYWTTNYMSEITSALTNGLPEEEQEIELCFVTTDICKGVDRSKFRINKYQGPSKRKIQAALKAAKGETDSIAQDGDEEEEKADDDVTTTEPTPTRTEQEEKEDEPKKEGKKEEKQKKKKKGSKKGKKAKDSKDEL